jgi:ribosomal protein S18 acetylase RimI-like enzyme
MYALGYHHRAAVESDFDFLLELHEVTLRDHVDAIWGWDDEVQRKMCREAFARNAGRIVIVDGVDNGFVRIDERADCHSLELLELHPRVQRRGIGATIVRAFVGRAYEARLPAILRVFKINVGARRLYQRLGFAIVGENETHYDMRHG